MFRTVVFALAVSAPCLGSSARADEGEDRAVAFVQKLEGTVTRDENAPGKPVVTVNLCATHVTDADLKQLAPLKNLNTLDLRCAGVTDAALKELAPLDNLNTLSLSGWRLTDAGLQQLAPLKNLNTLYLRGTRVTAAGLKELAPLKNLNTLYPKGHYAHVFRWDGRNWEGPSDTGAPKGAAFPPGSYTLDVSCQAVSVGETGRPKFRAAGQVEITLVK